MKKTTKDLLKSKIYEMEKNNINTEKCFKELSQRLFDNFETLFNDNPSLFSIRKEGGIYPDSPTKEKFLYRIILNREYRNNDYDKAIEIFKKIDEIFYCANDRLIARYNHLAPIDLCNTDSFIKFKEFLVKTFDDNGIFIKDVIYSEADDNYSMLVVLSDLD